jgi:hypothetical protein
MLDNQLVCPRSPLAAIVVTQNGYILYLRSFVSISCSNSLRFCCDSCRNEPLCTSAASLAANCRSSCCSRSSSWVSASCRLSSTRAVSTLKRRTMSSESSEATRSEKARYPRYFHGFCARSSAESFSAAGSFSAVGYSMFGMAVRS